jgi:hypothetical protein
MRGGDRVARIGYVMAFAGSDRSLAPVTADMSFHHAPVSKGECSASSIYASAHMAWSDDAWARSVVPCHRNIRHTTLHSPPGSMSSGVGRHKAHTLLARTAHLEGSSGKGRTINLHVVSTLCSTGEYCLTNGPVLVALTFSCLRSFSLRHPSQWNVVLEA